MMAFSWLCGIVWALLAHTVFVRAASPLLPSTTYITINPTQTTITLEKPYCLSTAGNAVYLYVMQSGASSNAVINAANNILTTTYSQSTGGSKQPYLAASFAIPSCSSLPDFTNLGDPTKAQSILDSYIVRVGADVTCLTDPNFTGYCNPPLNNSTAYRFKYVYADAGGVAQYQTDWSAPITTNGGKAYSTIDTWPGRRSGGMIVLTSILSVLLFFLLVGFAGTIFAWVTGGPTGVESTAYDTRTSIKAPAKPSSSAEPVYSTTHEYSPHPQA
ncbi:uroplakin-3a isoform X1 [Pelobates cultripes]|uniref:Uroplakin-3a isoform X1 n=2 Tax=Pelobates cultripes TaxID=61616 RepID=A0AAD1W2Y3_PELCU|nr:uroplakin-3a isoform X1 [Pelobates cultripes]